MFIDEITFRYFSFHCDKRRKCKPQCSLMTQKSVTGINELLKC